MQATPAIAVRPFIEYFVNPDNVGDLRLGRPKDGIELGLFTVVALGRLLGTSNKPF